jgi:hypothetical protein
MNSQEALQLITWHVEVGSALDTRVKRLGAGLASWEGELSGPRFDVRVRLETRLEGDEVVASARMVAAPGSHLFDMVLGCRLLCPPGRLHRPPLGEVDHAGTGSYLALPDGNITMAWGEHGSCYTAGCEKDEIPLGFAWCPYIADEPDGWRLHARIRATGGKGFRRIWILGRDIFHTSIRDGAQDVGTESNAHSPFYRLFRAADYREQTARESFVYRAHIRVFLPQGIVP